MDGRITPGERKGRNGGSAVGSGHYTSTPDGVRRGSTFHPVLKPVGWSDCRFHLGNDKEVSGVESYALCHALKAVEARGEEILFFWVYVLRSAVLTAQNQENGLQPRP